VGDAKRFWRESIGVVAPGGAGTASTESARPPAAASSVPRLGPLMGAAQLAQINAALGRLPIGSIAFADEVGRRLWRNPAAEDLRLLSIVAENEPLLPSGSSARELAVRCVAIRQRSERLAEQGRRAALDPAPLQFRAAEWSRLARSLREGRPVVDSALAKAPNAALAAARALLPDPADIDAEAALAAEAAALVDAARGSRPHDETSLVDFPEASALLDRCAAKTNEPDDVLFLAGLACCTLAARAAAGAPRETLDRARRGVAVVARRFDEAVETTLAEHKRNQERNAVLAAWRRRLGEAKRRIDEALTRPVSGAPAEPLADEAMVERLRTVRGQVEQPRPAPAHAPKGWRGWFKKS